MTVKWSRSAMVGVISELRQVQLDGYATRSLSGERVLEQLEAALAEIDLLRPVVDIAERWTDDSKVQDETLMDAVRAMRRARGT